MHRMMFWILTVGVLMWLSDAAAQSSGQPVSRPNEQKPFELEVQTSSHTSDLSVEEAVKKALTMFDRWEGPDRDELTREDMDTLNQYITMVRQNEPSNPWLHYLIGRAHALAGRRHDAIERVEDFVLTREGRNEWRAFRFLGDLFVDQFPRLAKANYEKAAALKVNEPGILYGLSLCAYQFGDYDKAIRLAREAVITDGRRSIPYLSHLVRSTVRRKKWKEAMSAASSALSVAKERVEENPGKTALLVQVNIQYQLVIDAIQARLLDTDSLEILTEGYLQLADTIIERSKIIEKLALHDVMRALQSAVTRTAPDTPLPLLKRYGVALAEVGRKKKAIEIFQEILQKDPDHEIANHWLNRLQSDPASSSHFHHP